MKPFKSLKKAVKWVETRVKFKPKADLTKMTAAFSLLNINAQFKKIHVAGTNGKGSTTSYVSNILIEAGYKVGSFLSPYLIKFNERIRLNMQEIDDDNLLRLLNFIHEFENSFFIQYDEHLSFFELLTLVALKYFDEQKCDFIVMEVGIGGLLDSTNVLKYDLSLITNIGFDHMKQLGTTLESIAYNKLGILKEYGILVSTVNNDLFPLFEKYVLDKNAIFHHIPQSSLKIISENPLIFDYLGVSFHPKLLGRHQAFNAALAIKGIKELDLGIEDKFILKGINETTNPGRLEVISKNPLVVIDGAHNIHGISALISSIGAIQTGKLWVIFSALKDKEPVKMINMLQEISSNIVLTTFDDPRKLSISDIIMELNDVVFVNDFKKAFHFVKVNMNSDDTLLITGSIHFIGYVKKVFSTKKYNCCKKI